MLLTELQHNFINFVDEKASALIPKLSWSDLLRKVTKILPEDFNNKASKIPFSGKFFQHHRLLAKQKLTKILNAILVLPTYDFNAYANLLILAVNELQELLNQTENDNGLSITRRIDIRLFINDGILQGKELQNIHSVNCANYTVQEHEAKITLELAYVWEKIKSNEFSFIPRNSDQITINPANNQMANHQKILESLKQNSSIIVEIEQSDLSKLSL